MNRIISFFKDKGFYVALAACILVAAGSSFWAIRNVMDNLNKPQQPPQQQEEVTPWQLPKIDVDKPVSDVPKPSAKPSPASSSSSGSADVQQPDTDLQESAVPVVPSFVKPVDGKITRPFSGDELVYNETLGDWRTHNGVDLACAEGEAVKNAVDGKVCNVYEDGMWGQVVEVEAGELVWRYTGLDASDLKVKTGDTVTAGQQLGKLKGADAEIGEEPHLHLEVLKGGNPVDPEHYFE